MQVYILIGEWDEFCNGKKIHAIKANMVKMNNDNFKKINVCMDEILVEGSNWVTIEKHY